jgi:hypothetical protein
MSREDSDCDNKIDGDAAASSISSSRTSLASCRSSIAADSLVRINSDIFNCKGKGSGGGGNKLNINIANSSGMCKWMIWPGVVGAFGQNNLSHGLTDSSCWRKRHNQPTQISQSVCIGRFRNRRRCRRSESPTGSLLLTWEDLTSRTLPKKPPTVARTFVV